MVVHFNIQQGQVVPQRQTAEPLRNVGANRQLRQMIRRNRQQIRRDISRVRLQRFYSRRTNMYYFAPRRLELRLDALPPGFRYVSRDATTHFLEETIGTQVVLYRIVPERNIPRFPMETGVSSFIVFYQRDPLQPHIVANETYSTWIVPLNDDFTLILNSRNEFHLLDEHIGVTYRLSKLPPL